MKTLLLMRHAKSDWSGGEADFDRPLNERGRAAALRMAQELRGRTIDRVLCSPALRTRQTLERLAIDAPLSFEGRIYEASTGELVDLVAGTHDSVGALLLVGHMPAIAGLALALAEGDPGPECRRLQQGYPTAALAELSLSVDHWRDIARGCGRVERFTRARELD